MVHGLLQAAPDAILAVDHDGRIVFANTQAERLFGYTRDELMGLSVDALVPDQFRSAHPAHRADYSHDLQPRPMGTGGELAGRRRDGSEFPAEVSLSAVEADGRTLVAAAVRDVTERQDARKEYERLRAQAEEERLERKHHQSQRLESLGQLAGGVAHDFNNLLAVILNYASFVKEEVAAEVGRDDSGRWDSVRSDVTQIELAAERAAELTRQLLAFARREVVRPKVLNLNEAVGEVEQLLRRTIGEHIELVTSLAPGLWSVLADGGQVEQVLLNLAVNARDAMPSGGMLMIETSNVTADEAYVAARPDLEPGAYVCLRVGDTGTGMPAAVRDRAFEPFFTTKPKGKGSGLGLATAYGIVNQAGGRIQIYSEDGVGTTVTALFPVTDAVMVEDVRPLATNVLGQSETVLVVEDEDAMREVTRRILVRNGYSVLVASGAQEALETIREHPGPVDLLLTDVVMPHMLGKELAERAQDERPGLRVLFMSGYAQPVLGANGTLDPGVTLVQKPFSELVLLGKVRDALEGAS
jgi:PAS domain S-box-containing protein